MSYLVIKVLLIKDTCNLQNCPSNCAVKYLWLPTVPYVSTCHCLFCSLEMPLAALFYSPVNSPMHQTCIRVMHVWCIGEINRWIKQRSHCYTVTVTCRRSTVVQKASATHIACCDHPCATTSSVSSANYASFRSRLWWTVFSRTSPFCRSCVHH